MYRREVTLLPTCEETLVLPRKAKDIAQRLAVSTSDKPFLQADEAELLFSGWVKPDRFRIALRMRRPNHFIPLVIGTIEPTNSGCLVSLSYQLFPVTRYLLLGWTLFVLFGGLVSLLVFHNHLLAVIGVAILGLMHYVTRFNFQFQLRLTREAIHRVVA
ncbi:MAG: hypothetical protein JNN04_07120 [Cyclobacteriaceae bacterium]|nr:hypothetical protein [Cyclobacteriaceae bacterium]